jgi:GNAT superfamily N-acetyltransferase
MFGLVQPLSLGDLPGCLALARDRGWPPEERKWQLLFAVGTVYGLRGGSGDLAGVVALTRYGPELAAIGMLLVAARYGGQGLGRRIMSHALAEAGDATVFLSVAGSGGPLCEKLGFVTAGMTHTHAGEFAAGRGTAGSRPAEQGDLPAIRELDARCHGADRARLVRFLPGFTEHLRVIERHGFITGYAGGWRNVDQVVIGPVIAGSADDAQTLVADIAGAVTGPVRLDLDGRHPQLREWVTGHGLTPQASSAVMVRGGRRLPGDRARWFAPLMPALG